MIGEEEWSVSEGGGNGMGRRGRLREEEELFVVCDLRSLVETFL